MQLAFTCHEVMPLATYCIDDFGNVCQITTDPDIVCHFTDAVKLPRVDFRVFAHATRENGE